MTQATKASMFHLKIGLSNNPHGGAPSEEQWKTIIKEDADTNYNTQESSEIVTTVFEEGIVAEQSPGLEEENCDIIEFANLYSGARGLENNTVFN